MSWRLLNDIGSVVARDDSLVPGTSTKKNTCVCELVFKREELLYDIANMAYVEGDITPAQDSHERHQIQDVVEDGNIDRVLRKIDLAVDACTEALYPYTKTEIDLEESREDTLESEGDYYIGLMLPTDFSKTTVNYLEKLIHEYIVCYVLADWMSITNIRNTQSAVNWSAKLEETKDEMQRALFTRYRRIRRTSSPF